ncbi:hypothetical protein XH87_00475 [Bradyrhizobium sp. CCBAU 53415]|nr:hypothetical protein [Bradyrhizobium sp. CCBAU 53415]
MLERDMCLGTLAQPTHQPTNDTVAGATPGLRGPGHEAARQAKATCAQAIVDDAYDRAERTIMARAETMFGVIAPVFHLM